MFRYVQDKFLNFILRKMQASASTCDHEWEVVGAASADVTLELCCHKCASWANVLDPTEEEWAAAYGAGENPYLWTDAERVNWTPTDEVWQLEK